MADGGAIGDMVRVVRWLFGFPRVSSVTGHVSRFTFQSRI